MTQMDIIDKFEAYETEAKFTRGNKMTTQVVAMDDIRTVVAEIADELANGANTEQKALHIDSVSGRSELLFDLLRFAMSPVFTDIALKSIVKQFLAQGK